MDKAMSRESYQELVEDVRACVRACVPPGAVVLIASKGDEDLVQIEGLRAWHFPRDEWGSYAGHHPASSVEAIVHLRHLFAQGARYLVFPATAAWWLEHYRELADLLDSAHELKMSHDGVCVVYELRESAAFEAFAAMDPGGASWDGGDDKAGAPTQLLTLARPAPRPSLRVLTILTRFGSEQYAEAEVEIADLFTQQLRPVERRVIVVDNALPREFVEQRHDGSVLIGGDNSSREFSAFDRALEWVGADVWSYDFVHLATSAFNTLYVAYLERFGPSLLAAAAGRPACIGHIDCYNEPIRVRTYHAQHWIRSCFFFLPPAELRALGSLVSIADGRPFFSGDPDVPVPRRRSARPAVSRIHHEVAHRCRGGPGRHVAFDVRADARHDRRIRAEGARHPQRAAAQHPAAGARLPSRRRHLAVGDVARAPAARGAMVGVVA